MTPLSSGVCVLQWGRGFAATEGSPASRSPAPAPSFNGAVALQPRKARPPGRPASCCGRFNGAVALQPRKGQTGKKLAATLAGFNGAVALQPRKDNALRDWMEAITKLQWGRGFAATEGLEHRHQVDAGLAASMGPWLCSHGRGAADARSAGLRGASMGPWLCSHGRPRSGFVQSVITQLQWGRGFAATEGRSVVASASYQLKLQWGRGFAATEG